MKKLILVILIAMILAAIPLIYRPEERGYVVRGKLKDVGSRIIVVETEEGDEAFELRGDYEGGYKWHQVLERLRGMIGEEVVVKVEIRGRAAVAVSIELPMLGIKY
jgi:hypothetical protein